ncbi:MAG: hypothetical protein V1781_09565 [Bacteroidota bacterium]
MAKKKSDKKQNLRQSDRIVQLNKEKIQSSKQNKQWLILAGIAILTFISFYPSLNCGFTNWDDGTYVTENHLIWKLDVESIKKFFSTPVSLNYHPLTMLTLAFDYKIDKLNPYYYHLNNVLLHVLNTLLVFIFISRFVSIYNKKKNNQMNFAPILLQSHLSRLCFSEFTQCMWRALHGLLNGKM